MPSLDIFNPFHSLLKELQIEDILGTNEASLKYGLMLTTTEARELIEVRNQALQNTGRVELGTEVTRQLIERFCASPFMLQEDYSATLNDLQEIFYYLKNETEDVIGDNDLIEVMQDSFDNFCGGSLELLKGTTLEAFARDYRRNNQIRDALREGEDLDGI